jgi:hypothetical protein
MMARPEYRTPVEHVGVLWANFGIALLTVVVLFGTFTMTWPYEPLPRLKITVAPTVEAGDYLPIQVDYCKTMRISPRGRWSLQDGIVIELAGGIVALPIGCQVTMVQVGLNPKIPGGSYRAVVEAHYDVWPWRTVRYRAESNAFTLVRR